MDLLWILASTILGLAVVLASDFRFRRKRGEAWLGAKPGVVMATYILIGPLGGWFVFYHLPLAVWRGATAEFDLLFDPATRGPYIGFVVSLAAALLGRWVWSRRGRVPANPSMPWTAASFALWVASIAVFAASFSAAASWI